MTPNLWLQKGMYGSPLVLQAIVACFYNNGVKSEGSRYEDFFNFDETDRFPRELLALVLSIVRTILFDLVGAAMLIEPIRSSGSLPYGRMALATETSVWMQAT